jgi:large subunit ribosomal protein L10
MAITRNQKQAMVQELVEKMGRAQSIMFAHYIGLTVADVSAFRDKLREVNAEMKVAKKTLTSIAAKQANLPEISEESMPGPISLIFSFDDPLSGAQVAFKFAKDHNQVALVGGIFDGKVLSKQEAMELAKMPSRQVLLATFMGMVQSPLTKFAALSATPLSSFARGLNQLAEKGGIPGKTPAAPAAPEAAAPTVEETPAAEEPAAPAASEAPSEPASPTA